MNFGKLTHAFNSIFGLNNMENMRFISVFQDENQPTRYRMKLMNTKPKEKKTVKQFYNSSS